MRHTSAALSLAIALCGLSGVASATPFTYDFKLPNWEYSNSNYFGSSGLLTVTFDNGKASNASQTYLSSDITSLTLAGDNGMFTHTWLPSGHRQGMDLTFFSTDSRGVATLYLPVVAGENTNQPASLWLDYNTGQQASFQLGVMSEGGGATPISVIAGGLWPDIHYASVTQYDSRGYTPFSVQGILRADVPEPVSLGLLGIGLAALLTSRRYKSRA